MPARGTAIIVGIILAVVLLTVWLLRPSGPEPRIDQAPSVPEAQSDESATINQSTRVVLVLESEGPSATDIQSRLDTTVSILRTRCAEQFPDRPPTVTALPPDTIVVLIDGALDCRVAHDILARRGLLELKLVAEGTDCEAIITRIDSVIVANSSVGDRDPRPFTSVLRRQQVPCQWYVWDDNKERIDNVLKRDNVQSVIPETLEFLWDAQPHFAENREYNVLHLVERGVSVDGRDITNAVVQGMEGDMPTVAFQLSPDGAKRLKQLTGSNIGRALAIVMDNGVESTPLIRAQIDAQGMIALRSDATLHDAQVLALLLRHRPYPSSVKVVECRVVQR